MAHCSQPPSMLVLVCCSQPARILVTSKIWLDAKIAILDLGNSTWRIVRLHLERIVLAVNAASPGSYGEIDIPSQ